MNNEKKGFRTEEELDEYLSRPTDRLIQMMKSLSGDIMILGAGGKMGPSVAMTARKALDKAGVSREVIAVDKKPLKHMEEKGIRTIECDLLNYEDVRNLPRAENIIFMAGRKFGEVGSEPLTWMINCIVPYNTASCFTESRWVAFSTGCVYPLVPTDGKGCSEDVAPAPVGEYAHSCLGRERIFDYFSQKYGFPLLHFRLNYSVELRYGVLVDVARAVHNNEPVSRSVTKANILWQADAVERALLSLQYGSSPPRILNVTGKDTIDILEVARTFGRIFGKEVRFTGEDTGMGYLSDASQSIELFGEPSVSVEQMIEWIADWLRRGGRLYDAPTHFEVTDGQFLDETEE